jgi:inorganic pyrophosphatase
MDKKVRVYIEIEKDSNIKYEFDKESNKLEVDRILPEPYYYPYCYGFIPYTLAMDNDELDALIITDKKLKNNKVYEAFIIGALMMCDEKGMDEKILCVLEEDYSEINCLDKLSDEIKENIHWFFSNYKSETPDKWSTVYGFAGKDNAIKLYETSRL